MVNSGVLVKVKMAWGWDTFVAFCAEIILHVNPTGVTIKPPESLANQGARAGYSAGATDGKLSLAKYVDVLSSPAVFWG